MVSLKNPFTGTITLVTEERLEEYKRAGFTELAPASSEPDKKEETKAEEKPKRGGKKK